MYIMVVIDAFSRFIVTIIIQGKKSSTLRATIEEWCGLGYISELFMIDNGKEFQNSEFNKLLRPFGIEHNVAGIEDHRSNERVRRVIIAIREGLQKMRDAKLKDKIAYINKTCNNTYHVSINRTPLDDLENTK